VIDIVLNKFCCGGFGTLIYGAEVEHVGGNMFESVPSGGDAIFLKVCSLSMTNFCEEL
jgi:hypothetical protein